MTMIAVCFVLRSMLPSRCQLSIKGPKARCSRNQLFSRSEDRANAKAATNRNGVVGNRGSTTPRAPMATAARPANNQKNRVFALTLAVHHTTIGSCKPGRFVSVIAFKRTTTDPIESARRAVSRRDPHYDSSSGRIPAPKTHLHKQQIFHRRAYPDRSDRPRP